MQALQIRNLKKVYDNGFTALKGIDLEVAEGDFFALLGPNGAGKSTTIGVITSLVRKTQGEVRVFGHCLDASPTQVKRCLGVVPQEFNFNMFERVQDIVINQGGYYGLSRAKARQRAQHYLTLLGLWDKRDEPSRELSGGMKRRLMIARALVHDPRLLILDEPTAGVDIELRRSMWQFLEEINQEAGVSIILTTHYLEEAESLCRNIAIIDGGEIIENTSMKQLLAQLDKETFILDLDQRPSSLQIAGYDWVAADGQSIEVQVEKQQGLNGIFDALSAQQIQVTSLRNKSNRLEELFVTLLQRESEASV